MILSLLSLLTLDHYFFYSLIPTTFSFFLYPFFHANWNHFFSNYLIILLLGPPLESKYGSMKFLKFVIMSIIFVGIINYFFNPNPFIIGSSGLVFTFISMISMNHAKINEIPITGIYLLFLAVGKEIVDGLFLEDNISQITHILGAVIGLLIVIWDKRQRIKKLLKNKTIE